MGREKAAPVLPKLARGNYVDAGSPMTDPAALLPPVEVLDGLPAEALPAALAYLLAPAGPCGGADRHGYGKQRHPVPARA